MTWFEFCHALSDLRHRRGWYGTYAYASLRPLIRVEVWLRKRSCRKNGHAFPGGADGEWKHTTWKHFCVRCWAKAPYDWDKE